MSRRERWSFGKTKNGLPHSIPLPHQAVAILDGLRVNAHGLFFPHFKNRLVRRIYG
jgi:hypothetical protein